ncbi:hypothetical protein V3A08_00080 [Tenacibaculum maritimum]|uniref:hypothetical protein n=1 Tax=Tenacibaculum maritimum TaxID=107401 RepID=UPI0012E57118|nr:hypothetical protein [Tenacibaculum maritimum]CAA0224453.1 hypothetical protein DPIF89300162_50017 [Tenacibaculum maritimum]
MSGNKLRQQSNGNSKPIDSAMFKEFIEVQKEKISLEKSELELKKQHLKSQADLAKQSLTIQEKLLEKAPKEKRKNRSQSLIFGVIFTLIILGFSAFCLANNHEKFLTYLIGTISHLGTLFLGYYFGKQNNKNKNENSEIQDAEIID